MVQTRTADRPHGPLPRIRTTQLYGNRRWQGPGVGTSSTTRPRSRASHSPRRPGTEYFSIVVEDVPAAGSRPDRLAGVRPQERIQRRSVEQTVDAPLLLTLDSPAPLMVEQLVDVLQFVDALVPVAEQVF